MGHHELSLWCWPGSKLVLRWDPDPKWNHQKSPSLEPLCTFPVDYFHLDSIFVWHPSCSLSFRSANHGGFSDVSKD